MKSRAIIYLLALTGLFFLLPNKETSAQSSESQFGKDSVKCIQNISLYREFYRQWKTSKYKNEAIYDAVPYWRWVFKNCPKAKERTYVDGTNIYDFFIENAKDDDQREKYIDTLMLIYDTRIKYFDNRGKNLARKAYDHYKYRTTDYETAYNLFKESVTLLKDKSQSHSINYYFKLTQRMVMEGKADVSLIFDTYDELMAIINKNIDKGKNLAVWTNIKGIIESGFEEYAKCEDIVELYGEKLKEHPNNIELLKKAISLLDKKDCKDDPLYYESVVQLYNLEPTPESAYFIAKMNMTQGNFKEAINYLKKSTSIEDNEKLADIYYYLSSCYFNLKNYRATRSNAYKALKYNPKMGKALILIGDCYVLTAKSIGDNELTSRSAYWAAVDKYKRAKSIDPSIGGLANKKINDYTKYFPTMENIFFYNYEVGQEFLVGGWIQEKTTIRPAPEQ